MGGESSDAWRSVLDDLIVRQPPQPSASLTPHPTMRVRDYIRGANPAGSGREQSYRCTINMYLIRRFIRGIPVFPWPSVSAGSDSAMDANAYRINKILGLVLGT